MFDINKYLDNNAIKREFTIFPQIILIFNLICRTYLRYLFVSFIFSTDMANLKLKLRSEITKSIMLLVNT